MHDGYPNRCPFNEIVKRFRSLEKIWKNDFTLTQKVKPTEGSGAISWNLSNLGAEHSLHVSLGDLLPDSFQRYGMRTFIEALMLAYDVPAQVEKTAQSWCGPKQDGHGSCIARLFRTESTRTHHEQPRIRHSTFNLGKLPGRVDVTWMAHSIWTDSKIKGELEQGMSDEVVEVCISIRIT